MTINIAAAFGQEALECIDSDDDVLKQACEGGGRDKWVCLSNIVFFLFFLNGGREGVMRLRKKGCVWGGGDDLKIAFYYFNSVWVD